MSSAVALVAGIAVVGGIGIGWLSVPLALLAVAAFQVASGRLSLPLLTVVVLAASIGALRVSMEANQALPDAAATTDAATVRIDGMPRSTSSGTMVVAVVEQLRSDTRTVTGDSFRVLLTFKGHLLLAPGDVLDVTWSLSPLDTISPGYGRWVASLGVQGSARVWSYERSKQAPAAWRGIVSVRSRVTEALEQALPGDAGALAAGIVTGDDSRLSDGATAAFRRTGTAHITAVSGSNIAMILTIWTVMVPARRLHRSFLLRITIALTVWLYALCVGFEPPAVRAAIMASLVLAAARSGRRPDAMTLLALTSAGMALVQPLMVASVSFWLSVVASAAIVSRMPTDAEVGWQRAVRSLGEGVIAAQVWTLPIVLLVFGSWSFSGIFANLVLAPILWLAFPLCFILAIVATVLPWLGPLAALPAMMPLELALAVVRSLSLRSASVAVAGGGVPAVIGVVGPCLLGAALLSRDVKRWVMACGDTSGSFSIPRMLLVGTALGLGVSLMIALYGYLP